MAPFSLVPTPLLEMMLNDAPQEAVDEYLRLREAHCHLVNHLRATKTQTEATVSGLQSLLDEIKPDGSTHFARRRLE